MGRPQKTGFLGDAQRDDAGYPDRPRAFINYIFFDEQFRFAGGGLSSVANTPGLTENHHDDLSDIEVPRNGYVYIYVSNESPVNVYFDNLQVVHTRGPLLEETHYYPFGLTMAGISSKALGFAGKPNKKKFNSGTELNMDFDVNLYEATFRSLDPQLRRFWQVDPMGEAAFDHSLYSYADNNPLTFNDPLGLFSDSPPETSTAEKPKELEGVVVTGVRKISNKFLPYLIFPNNRPYSIASDKEWPMSFSRNRANDLVDSWAMGLGAENRVYHPNHPMTKRLKNAYRVGLAKAFFYKKYIRDYKTGQPLKNANVIGYAASFGYTEFVLAGADIVEQFVGSFTLDIHTSEDGSEVLFVLKILQVTSRRFIT